MKKFTLIFAFAAITFASYSQALMVATTPSNITTTQLRAPNGLSSQAYLRSSSLVLTGEMTYIPATTTLSAFGFTATAGANAAVTGSITVYLMNSSDVTFNLGTNWPTIISGMTTVYTGTIALPTAAGVVDLPLTTPFVYNGGSLYVAYDFVSAGPFATVPVTYGANNTLANGCVSAASATSAPTTLGTTNFRPTFRFSAPNTYTNEMQVDFINTMGNAAQVLGIGTPLSAIVRNNSSVTLNNIPVMAAVTGANSFADTQTVTTIASGATATVNFAAWPATAIGANTITVTTPADQFNGNNSRIFKNMVTCNTGGFAENPSIYTQNVGFATSSGVLSTSVTLPVSATVTGVNMAISSNTPSVGNKVYGVMLDNIGTIIATSINTLTIANANLNTIYSFTFNTPVPVTASQVWYVGMAQTANTVTAYHPFGAFLTPYLTASFFTSSIIGSTPTPLAASFGQFGIEANFAGTCGPLSINNLVASSDNNLIVYPNPANTALYVKLGSVTDKAAVTVYNTIGQVVIEAKEITDNSAEINVSSLVKGIYILKITNGKEVSNTKIVVEH